MLALTDSNATAVSVIIDAAFRRLQSGATRQMLRSKTLHHDSREFNDSFTLFLTCSGPLLDNFRFDLEPFGVLFEKYFGTKSAQEDPRWAQDDHREPQSTGNLHLQKT